MDKQAAIDRILENENLTGGLEDQDAKLLLDWGLSRLALFSKNDDPVALDKMVNALMVVMHQVNQVISSRETVPVMELASALLHVSNAWNQAIGAPRTLNPQEALSLAAWLAEQPSSQALETLLQTLSPISHDRSKTA